MADPYAERPREPAAQAPAGDPPWLGLVAERGGWVLRQPGERPPSQPAFVAIACRDTGALPPIARLGAEQAAMLAAADAEPLAPGEQVASDLQWLASLSAPIYALKHGWVAGPAGSPGAVDVDSDLVAAALDAIAADSVDWETDPDFGYEVIAAGPQLQGDRALALCPRLLYAAHDRVYEHADLVAALKRSRSERLRSVEGAPAAVVAAAGWPPEPTGASWKP